MLLKDFHDLITSLNREQYEYFFHIVDMIKKSNEPFYEFVDGQAGTGKTNLLNATQHNLIK
jgi:hypothetical protein